MVSIAFGMFVAVLARASSVISKPHIPSSESAPRIENWRLIGPFMTTVAGRPPRAKPNGW